MTRILLVLLLLLLLVRALWRLIGGIAEGAASGPRTPWREVKMVRDPVCGAFVVQSRALAAHMGDHVEYFCSEECRKAAQQRRKT